MAQERLETANANYQDAEEQRQAAKKQELLANEQRKIAVANEKTAKENEKTAREQELLARRRFYAAQMNLAQQAWEKGNPVRVVELLENQRPKIDEEDPRTFEWYYLWRLCYRQRRFALKHADVKFAAISPDGKLIACGDANSMVKVWDLATRRDLINFQGDGSSWVHCVAFSPDGKTLAAGMANGMIRLWDVASWQEKPSIKCWTRVQTLVISPDGKTVAAGTHDEYGGIVVLWDMATGKKRSTLKGHRELVLSVAFSPDSRTLASASTWIKPSVKLWDLTTQPPRVKREWDVPGPVAFFPDGEQLALGNWDHIEIWDLTNGQQRGSSPGGNSAASLAISPDGKIVATGVFDKTLHLWEPGTGRHSTLPHGQPVGCVCFLPDGKSVVAAGGDQVSIWNTAEASPEITLKRYSGTKSTMAYSPDGNTLAYPTSNGVVKLCNPVTGEERVSLNAQGNDFRGITFSRDSKRLAVGRSGAVMVWDVTTKQELATISDGTNDMQAIAIAPDGQTLAWGGASHNVSLIIYDVDRHRVRATRKHSQRVCAVTYTSDGKSVVSADQDANIQFWNSARFDKELGFTSPSPTPTTWLWDLALAPDGRTLVVSASSGWLKSFESATGKLLATFKGHTGDIRCVAVFPDCKTLISGSQDGTIKLWDLATGQERFSLLGHQEKDVTSVAVAPDGKAFASGGGTVTCESGVRPTTKKLWPGRRTWTQTIPTAPSVQPCRNKGVPEGAVAEFRRATELNPTSGPFYHRLGIALADEKKLDQAVALLQQGHRNRPETQPAPPRPR